MRENLAARKHLRLQYMLKINDYRDILMPSLMMFPLTLLSVVDRGVGNPKPFIGWPG